MDYISTQALTDWFPYIYFNLSHWYISK